MKNYLVEVKPHKDEGCTTIECDDFGVALRIALHCPRKWKIKSVTTNGIVILSTHLILTKDDVQNVVNEYLNPEVIEVV